MRHKQNEHAEQGIVVYWLRSAGILHLAVPNGGKRSAFLGKWLRDEGLSAGAPDLLIFDLTPSLESEGARGVAIEMKAIGGRPSDAQLRWRLDLEQRLWVTNICYGATSALSWLAKLGYKVPTGVINERRTWGSDSGFERNQAYAARSADASLQARGRRAKRLG